MYNVGDKISIADPQKAQQINQDLVLQGYRTKVIFNSQRKVTMIHITAIPHDISDSRKVMVNEEKRKK